MTVGGVGWRRGEWDGDLKEARQQQDKQEYDLGQLKQSQKHPTLSAFA